MLSIASFYKPQKIKILAWFHSFFSSPSLHYSRRHLTVGSLCINVLKHDVNTWYKFYKTFPLSVAIHFTHQAWFIGSWRMCHWSKRTVSLSHNVHVIFYFLPVFIKSTPVGKKKRKQNQPSDFLPLISCTLYFWLKKTVKHQYVKALILSSSKHFHSKGPVSVIYYFHKL